MQYKKEIPYFKKHFKVHQYFPEVFYAQHGLRWANKKIINYIKKRDILDIGAYCGDSLIILINYTKKKVYSYEYSPANMNLLKEAVKKNNIDRNKIILINKGIGNKSQIIKTNFKESSGSTIIENNNGTSIEITTIDDEVEKYHLNVGFMKADIEGMELQALQGAVKTILRDRPVISFSIYHNLQELFGIRRFLEHFPNYAFQYEVGSWDYITYGELIIFAYPKELS